MANYLFSRAKIWADISNRRLAGVVLTAVLFLFFAIAIGALARQALDQMRHLNRADSDNLQWTLSQTEVELLQLQNAVLRAQEGGDLADVRRWFDIFFSRMTIILTGPIYSTLSANPKIMDEFDHIRSFLAQTAPVIDGPDKELRAQLALIGLQGAQLHEDMRIISLEGIRVFSNLSDTQRIGVGATMQRIALVTVSLILLLLLAVFFLARIYGAALRQSAENLATRERLQAMLNTSLDAVLVVDREGRFVEFNGAASEIFGYSQTETLGKPMTELIFADHMIDAHNQGMRRHLETGEQRIIGKGRVQVVARRKSGEEFPVELSVARTMSPEGEIFVSYLRDISDRTLAEQRLTQARDDALAGERAKARFLAVMSHEMRTPLNGLVGSLELLKGTSLTQKQTEIAEAMQKSGALLLHHVNDVLDISRLESGQIAGGQRPVDLDALVQEVLESQGALAQAKGLDLRYRPEAGPIGTILGSSIGLRQMLLNLVNNAIKFTDKGFVEVQASILDADSAPRLSVRVRDTGIGIASADQARVFDDFVTLDSSFGRRADGTGLGLGIARRIAKSMGGDLGVVSQPKLGATFWIDLPIARAQTPPAAGVPAPKKVIPAKASRAVAARAAKTAKLDILIVEDNQINRFILREMLMAGGHRVTEAADGLEGVNIAQARRFDLIFMDISMPALDGIAATVRLRAGSGPCAQAPIVALTAHALPDDRALFLASGMNAVLNKPLDRAKLLHVLDELALSPLAKAARKKPSIKTPKPPLQNLPILRAGTYEELATALGQNRLAGLVARFVSEGDTTLESSLHALQNGQDAQPMLHNLAGAAATFGALALQAKLAQMETDLKQANPTNALLAHPDLVRIWAQTKAALAAC